MTGSVVEGIKKDLPTVAIGLPLLAVSWALIWTQDLFWNPVFFWGIWTGTALAMYALGQGGGTPGFDAMLSWRRSRCLCGGGSNWSTTG